jgi:hypothetical protein
MLQREFLTYIQQGFSPTRAVQRLQGLAMKEPDKWPLVEYATIMAWKAFDKDFADAYEVAYAMGTDQLEDKAVEMAYGGNASILQFLLKMRNPTRYAPRQEVGVSASGQIDHVHRVEIVAAPPRALEIENNSGQHIARHPDVVDAEVIEDD